MTTEALARYTLKDVDDLLTDVHDQPTRKDKVDHLAEHYPHLSRSWIDRRLHLLVSASAEQLVKVIGFPDPVGERATTAVLRERGY